MEIQHKLEAISLHGPPRHVLSRHSLKDILADWPSFSVGIGQSMIQMFFFKYQKLRGEYLELERQITDKYSTILSSWRTFLNKTTTDAGLTDKHEKRDFFGPSFYADLLEKQYPDFYREKKQLTAIGTLLVEMEKVKSTATVDDFKTPTSPSKTRRAATASMNKWSRQNVTNLKKAIEKTITDIEGREDVTDTLADILYAFRNKWENFQDEFLNFIITGPAGSGKTELATHMAEIFRYSGLVFRGDVKITSKENYIAQYVGQSAPLTKATMTDALESVLFVDEAYSLAQCVKLSPEGCNEFDTYGSESITTMIDYLSTHKGQMVMIMAGYEAKIQESVLSINEGVNRRFPYKMKLDYYDPETMVSIFLLFLRKKKVDIKMVTEEAKNILARAVNSAQNDTLLFVNQAGDMGNLASLVSTHVAGHDVRSIDGCLMIHLIEEYIQFQFSKTLMQSAPVCANVPARKRKTFA